MECGLAQRARLGGDVVNLAVEFDWLAGQMGTADADREMDCRGGKDRNRSASELQPKSKPRPAKIPTRSEHSHSISFDSFCIGFH